jgi:hypothetical protein
MQVPPPSPTPISQVATCEALGAVDASMLAIVAPKHLLSLSNVYAQPLALAWAPGPALIFREVCCRNPGPPRSSPLSRLAAPIRYCRQAGRCRRRILPPVMQDDSSDSRCATSPRHPPIPQSSSGHRTVPSGCGWRGRRAFESRRRRPSSSLTARTCRSMDLAPERPRA